MNSILRSLSQIWTRNIANRWIPKQQRKLFFEPMERREVLTADNLGAIAGVVYSDATDNGFTRTISLSLARKYNFIETAETVPTITAAGMIRSSLRKRRSLGESTALMD